MRLVRVRVPDDDRESVLSVLREEDVEFVLTSDLGGDDEASVVEFPVPTQGVEPVLESLRDAGFDDERYTVVVNAQTARTPTMPDLEERFIGGVEEQESVAHEEIRSAAIDLTPGPVPYYAMTLLSAVVAVAGLLVDSAAVVVGSMVIAPQVGSAMTASVGTVIDDRAMIRDGLRAQVFGLVLAVVGAAAFGALLQAAQFVPPTLDVATISQISRRISPGILSVTVGVAAGAAGALGLATALPVSLVGVMIAAALIPAAATVGIGIAWGLPTVAGGALLLLVVNAVSITLAAIAVFWLLDYRPKAWEGDLASLGEHGPAVATVGVLLVAAAAAAVPIGTHLAFENGATTAVQDVLDGGQYRDVELVQSRVGFTVGPRREGPPAVSVVVTRPEDERYPSLAADLAREIAATTGRDVSVQVEFRDRQSHRTGGSGA